MDWVFLGLAVAGLFANAYGQFCHHENKSQRGIKAFLVASGLGAAIAALSGGGPVFYLFAFWACIYAVLLTFAGFGRPVLPVLLQVGASDSTPFVSWPLGLLTVFCLVTGYFGNEYGSAIAGWVALAVSLLAYVGLYRKKLTQRTYGFISTFSLYALVPTLPVVAAFGLIIIQVPWFVPAIRRPLVEDQEKAEDLEDTEKPNLLKRLPSVQFKKLNVKEVAALFIPLKAPLDYNDRIEPRVLTLSDGSKDPGGER